MGTLIRKERGSVEYQTPSPRIEIILPPYDGSITVWLTPSDPGISSDRRHIVSNNLLSYTFSEGVEDLEGGFSFAVENEKVVNGKTLFDVIVPRSIIKIYEDESPDYHHPVFVGIVRKRHIGATMTASGPKRSVIFYGKSVISCITEFMVSLDVKLYDVQNATAETKKLTNELKSVTGIGEFMKIS
jgi:hypothetical protein